MNPAVNRFRAPIGLQNLIEAWKSFGAASFPPPAREDELRNLEAHLEQPLPSDLRALYSATNGAHLLDGNLKFDPVNGHEISLMESRSWIRNGGWRIPDQVLVFGGNGSDDLFGIWLAPTFNTAFCNPIIHIGEIREPGCMAVAATNLLSFLAIQTAGYFLFVDQQPTKALDHLGLPQELRFDVKDASDDQLEALGRWADPLMPLMPDDVSGDPYTDRHDAKKLEKIFNEVG
jgi:hypothetical protein